MMEGEDATRSSDGSCRNSHDSEAELSRDCHASIACEVQNIAVGVGESIARIIACLVASLIVGCGESVRVR